jgi:ribosome maturation factor RimP
MGTGGQAKEKRIGIVGTNGLSEMNGAETPVQSHMIAAGALERRIAGLIAPLAADMGYELVRVHLSGANGRTLQIMAERPDGTMKVEDCEELSHAVSALIDVEDPLDGTFHLEVSSPGIGRPLTRPKDFETWAGFEAKIELSEPLAERKRFRGLLQGFEEGEVLLEMDVEGYDEPQVIGLPFAQMREAKLVMTDALIEESLKRRPHG